MVFQQDNATKLRRMHDEIHELKQSAERLEQENERLKQVDAERVEKLLNANTVTRDAIKELEECKKMRKAAEENLSTNELLAAQTRNGELQKKNKAMEQQLSQMEQQQSAARTANVELQQKNQSLGLLLSAAKTANVELQQKNGKLQSVEEQVGAAQTLNVKLQQKNESLDTRLSVVLSEANALQTSVDSWLEYLGRICAKTTDSTLRKELTGSFITNAHFNKGFEAELRVLQNVSQSAPQDPGAVNALQDAPQTAPQDAPRDPRPHPQQRSLPREEHGLRDPEGRPPFSASRDNASVTYDFAFFVRQEAAGQFIGQGRTTIEQWRRKFELRMWLYSGDRSGRDWYTVTRNFSDYNIQIPANSAVMLCGGRQTDMDEFTSHLMNREWYRRSVYCRDDDILVYRIRLALPNPEFCPKTKERKSTG